MKLKEAAKKVEDGIEETLTYCDFPSEHWTRIRTNNVIETAQPGDPPPHSRGHRERLCCGAAPQITYHTEWCIEVRSLICSTNILPYNDKMPQVKNTSRFVTLIH